jgi:hypothetical protein
MRRYQGSKDGPCKQGHLFNLWLKQTVIAQIEAASLKRSNERVYRLLACDTRRPVVKPPSIYGPPPTMNFAAANAMQL